VVFLEDGCQLSHFVVPVSDVPLGDLEATTDQELTDLASTSGAGGEDLSPAAARVRAELGSASAPPMDALEFRLSEPNTVEDSDGMSWTRVEALRASPVADVFLSVLYICPSTAAKDLSDQEDLLLHRLEGLTVVATSP